MTIDIDHLKILDRQDRRGLRPHHAAAGRRASTRPSRRIWRPVPQGDAPLALHWCLAPPIAPMSAHRPGRPCRQGRIPAAGAAAAPDVGGRHDRDARSRCATGDEVTRRSTIGDISYKEGRSGPLCFVAVDHEIVTERGVALRERHNIVYREAAKPGAEPPRLPRRSPGGAAAGRSDLAGRGLARSSCSAIRRSPSTATASTTTCPM